MHGYDEKSGHLFTWDREFVYAGRATNPPGSSFVVGDENRIQFCMAGAFFLGGVPNRTSVFWSDGRDERIADLFIDSSFLVCLTRCTPPSKTDRIVLCGPGVAIPEFVASFCDRFPTNPIYVCPLVDELAAFGALVAGLFALDLDWPRRANLFQPFVESLDGEGREYDQTLPGDGYGRMALAVSQGAIVVNQMMTGPGLSAFYGRMLAAKPVFPKSVYIINADCIDIFLPTTPVSLKVFAATNVPVVAKVSARFREVTGHQDDEAVVFVASDFIDGLGDFMRFYGAMTKQGVIASGWLSSSPVNGRLPVFRYNMVSVTSDETMMEILNGCTERPLQGTGNP